MHSSVISLLDECIFYLIHSKSIVYANQGLKTFNRVGTTYLS